MYIVGFDDGVNKYYLDMLCTTYNDACDITNIIHRSTKYDVYIFKHNSVPTNFKALPWDVILTF